MDILLSCGRRGLGAATFFPTSDSVRITNMVMGNMAGTAERILTGIRCFARDYRNLENRDLQIWPLAACGRGPCGLFIHTFTGAVCSRHVARCACWLIRGLAPVSGGRNMSPVLGSHISSCL